MSQQAQRARIVPGQPVQASSPKLLDRVRDAIRARHYSIRTEEASVSWVRRFVVFHNKRPYRLRTWRSCAGQGELHTLVEGTVSVFKDFEIKDGAFVRKASTPQTNS